MCIACLPYYLLTTCIHTPSLSRTDACCPQILLDHLRRRIVTSCLWSYYISELVFEKMSINDRIIMPWHLYCYLLKGGILFYQFACRVLFPLYCLPFIYRVLSMHLVLLDSRFMSLDQPCSRLVSSLLECGMSRRYVAVHITSSTPNLSRGIHHPSMQEQYSDLLMKACN